MMNVGFRALPDGCQIDIDRGSFYLRSDTLLERVSEYADPALFCLALLSMSKKAGFRLDAPVTRDAWQSVNRVAGLWHYWCIPGVHRMRLFASNIVDVPEPAGGPRGICCFSTGVDSTYALVANRDRFSHALLIAGADYHYDKRPAFLQLERRARELCDRLHVQFESLTIDIRKFGFNWDLFHPLVLSAALHFFRNYGFTHAGYSADLTSRQEFLNFPQGNLRIIAEAMSQRSFPIRHLGGEVSRTEKMRRILSHDLSLGKLISVCYADKSRGDNCGTCKKCIRTRLNVIAAGFEQTAVFDGDIDIEAAFQRMELPETASSARAELGSCADYFYNLPESSTRRAVGQYMQKLRRMILAS